jgi:predicted ester cyclase
MPIEENKAIVRLICDEVFNQGNLAVADEVVWRWTMQGTHQGELFRLPATGKQARWTEIQIGRFADGKLVEHWISFDRLDLLQQLGMAPSSRHAG